MGSALHQFFLFFTTLFSAGVKVAQTAENLATVGEEMSGIYLESTRHDRTLALIEQEKQLGLVSNKPKTIK